MARKSGWQQFADNFTSTYGAVNKFSEEGAIRDINERSLEEQFDDTGAVTGYKYGDTLYNTMDDKGGLMRPTDTQLQSQNFKDTRKAMSRHGNWKEAQEMGLSHAKLEAQEEANRLARDTHDFNVRTAEAKAKQADVTISQAELNENKNQILLDYSSKVGSEEWVKNPGAGKKFLLEAAFKTGDQQFYTMISSMDESAINQKLNGAAQLMAGAKAALSKGQAGGQEELMALIDAQDGIKGNIKFITDKKSGAVSIVELDQEGNPTNAAPWAGKNWEDFSQNVMKRLDPLTALSITAKQQGVAETTAKIGLLNAQTLEALQKASGGGNSEKMAAIKLKAVTDFENNEGGLYQQALRKGDRKKADALLDSFKYEMNNFDKRRNKKGFYDQQKPAPAAPSAGGDVLNLSADYDPKADSNANGVGNNKTVDAAPAPETEKVLTKANIAEIAALDNEVTDIKAKVVELSKVRGLQSGGKARNEIQKLRKRLVGIEHRKYKIQN